MSARPIAVLQKPLGREQFELLATGGRFCGKCSKGLCCSRRTGDGIASTGTLDSAVCSPA